MLENVSLLKGLNNAQLEELESTGRRRKYKKNNIILGKDDTSDHLLILISGYINAYVDDEDEKRIIVNTMTAGDSFGELAMLSGEKRSANIIAMEDCEVIVFQRKDVFRFIEEAPEFCKNIIQILAKKVNALTEDVSSLALLDVYGRIARVIQQHIDSGSTGKLTQQDIANRVGSSREMVSRIFKDLRIGGYISIESKHISILKPLPKAW